jgi:SAM-dependent methyltransferase
MDDINNYLDMQSRQYADEASRWSLTFKDPVVGSYHAHNAFSDYDNYLFKGFDTTASIALEYGCGPGRNLIRYAPRFVRVDGVDLCQTNIDNAVLNLNEAQVALPNLYVNDGQNLPMIEDATYDVTFSVICLQHIAVHTRFDINIMQELYRVSRSPVGTSVRRWASVADPESVTYFEDKFNARGTNGACDVTVTDAEDELKTDLKLNWVRSQTPSSTICVHPCCDLHAQWIWFQVQK